MSRLDEIRQRLEEATKGPWKGKKISLEVLSSTNEQVCSMVSWGVHIKEVLANLDFISNTPTDIAFLLSEVERLQEEDRQRDKHSLVQIVKERDRLREENAQLQDHYDDVMARLDKINNDDDTLPYRIDTVIAEVENLCAELAHLQALVPRCHCGELAAWAWGSYAEIVFACDEHRYGHYEPLEDFWSTELPDPPGEETGG